MDLSDEEIICLDQSPSKNVVRLNQKSLNIDSGTLYQTIVDVDSDEDDRIEMRESRGKSSRSRKRTIVDVDPLDIDVTEDDVDSDIESIEGEIQELEKEIDDAIIARSDLEGHRIRKCFVGLYNSSVVIEDDMYDEDCGELDDNDGDLYGDDSIITNSDLGGHRIHKCFVGLYNTPVIIEDDFYDDDDHDESDVGKKMVRSHKKETLPRRSARKVTKEGQVRSSRRKRTVVEVDIEDSDDEDSGYDSPRAVASKSRRRREEEDGEKMSVEVSEYEKIRENNIKERLEMLKTLGIQSALDECKSGLKKTGEKRKSRAGEWGERRKSARLVAREEDEDYVPDLSSGDSEDRYAVEDPSDHSHDGIRRHPCRECSSCRVPDCRR